MRRTSASGNSPPIGLSGKSVCTWYGVDCTDRDYYETTRWEVTLRDRKLATEDYGYEDLSQAYEEQDAEYEQMDETIAVLEKKSRNGEYNFGDYNDGDDDEYTEAWGKPPTEKPVECISKDDDAVIIEGEYYDPCPICGDGEFAESSIDKINTLDNFPPLIIEPTAVNCGQLNEFAENGTIPDVLCTIFQVAISAECPCAVATPVTLSATMAPGPPGHNNYPYDDVAYNYTDDDDEYEYLETPYVEAVDGGTGESSNVEPC